MIRIGVTGTDTGVGKTVVSAALLAGLRSVGLRVAAMKPLETGVGPGDPGSDAERLRAAAGGTDPRELVGPIVLPDPLAPWIAAEKAGRTIDLDRLDRAFADLARDRDAIVVEGAGGLLVPISEGLAFDGLFRRWSLELLVVAADRLGVLNHTLLTVRAAEAAGLPVLGVVLNRGAGAADPEPPASNLGALRRLLPGVPVTTFPVVPDPTDVDRLAEVALRCGLDRIGRPGARDTTDPR